MVNIDQISVKYSPHSIQHVSLNMSFARRNEKTLEREVVGEGMYRVGGLSDMSIEVCLWGCREELLSNFPHQQKGRQIRESHGKAGQVKVMDTKRICFC